MKKKLLGLFTGFFLSISGTNFAQSIDTVVLNVYKEPTCGCCNGWIDHMNDNGYKTAFHHPTDIQKLKDEFGLKDEWRSCHTAVHETGYLFEGHIPFTPYDILLINKDGTHSVFFTVDNPSQQN
jgi:hypothetical protein